MKLSVCRGEIENSKKLYEVSYDAVDLFPNQVNAFVFHSIALALKNEVGEAQSFLSEAKLIAGKNEVLKTQINIAETWISIPSLSKDDIRNSLKSFDLSQITNPIFFEFVGDIYQVVPDNAKSKDFWQKAIELGGNDKRLKKKLGA